MTDLSQVPDDLPRPLDDGACDHLVGEQLPLLTLSAHDGRQVELGGLNGISVLFCYPMTGKPGVPLPANWDQIPGARGCTPQSCTYRDNFDRFVHHSAAIYGVSTQHSDDQREAAIRLNLPYRLLSDQDLLFASALRLPTFSVGDLTLIRRLTLICHNGIIVQSFYPIFPSDSDVPDVIQWLERNAA